MAEMLWILMLFQTRMLPETKRDNIISVWRWSGEELAASALLEDKVLGGIGFPGTAYDLLPYLSSFIRRVCSSFALLGARCELDWCEPVEARVWSVCVVVDPP